MLTDAYAAWYTVYAKTFGPHTPVDTLAKKEGKKAAEKIIRPFVNQYLRFFPVTDEDRKAMGIPNRDPKPTPINPLETGPLFSISIAGSGTLGIVYWNGETGRKGAKPKGVEGVRIYYGFEPVTNQTKLPHSEWATRCPHLLRFPEEDRRAAARGENPLGFHPFVDIIRLWLEDQRRAGRTPPCGGCASPSGAQCRRRVVFCLPRTMPDCRMRERMKKKIDKR
jgi:hypothetical protein